MGWTSKDGTSVPLAEQTATGSSAWDLVRRNSLSVMLKVCFAGEKDGDTQSTSGKMYLRCNMKGDWESYLAVSTVRNSEMEDVLTNHSLLLCKIPSVPPGTQPGMKGKTTEFCVGFNGLTGLEAQWC